MDGATLATLTIRKCDVHRSPLTLLSAPSSPAVETVLAMDADYSTAPWAFPSIFLLCDESINAKLLYVLKIIYHAHAIFRSVTFVQLP